MCHLRNDIKSSGKSAIFNKHVLNPLHGLNMRTLTFLYTLHTDEMSGVAVSEHFLSRCMEVRHF